jgi:hypothetical protein
MVARVPAFGPVPAKLVVPADLGLGEEGLGLEVGGEVGVAEVGPEGLELLEGGA